MNTHLPPTVNRMRFRAIPAAALLLCATLAACNEDPDPLFQPIGTGAISGRVYFDLDGDGQFNPVMGDTLAGAGVLVQVRQRGTENVLGSTATDATGSFTVSGVPLGTHDVFIPEQAITNNLVFCVNPRAASVYAEETAFVTVAARGGCVIRIAEAEAKPQGEVVTIYGVLTAAPGDFRSNNFYIQDNSGGIQVFGFSNPANLTLSRGDSIEVTGTLSQFSNELQLVSAAVGVTARPGAVPAPQVMTAAAIDALNPTSVTLAAAAPLGKLVKVNRVTVGAFASGNATITDATGSTQVRLDNAAATRIPTSTFTAGTCYDITGLLGSFNGAEQVKPRDLSDIVVVPCS